MADKAHVASLDALDAFRANLLVYVSQARPALEEVSAEVVRTRIWLESEQRLHWENQMRRRSKQLEEAQQALFSARLGILRHESAVELMAVQRAKRAVEEAEGKLRILKRWARDYESRVQPLLKQTEKLHTVLSNDMVKAVAYLTQALNTLSAYAQLKAPSVDGEPSAEPAAATETPPGGGGDAPLNTAPEKHADKPL